MTEGTFMSGIFLWAVEHWMLAQVHIFMKILVIGLLFLSKLGYILK